MLAAIPNGGTSMVSPRLVAKPTVMAAPSTTPASPPITASSIDSTRNCIRMCLRVAPRARRTPISVRRSSTDITMMLAMATPATRRATAPRPMSSPVRAWSAARLASRASAGRVTSTASGCWGLTVAGITSATALSDSGSARTYRVVGESDVSNRSAATG